MNHDEATLLDMGAVRLRARRLCSLLNTLHSAFASKSSALLAGVTHQFCTADDVKICFVPLPDRMSKEVRTYNFYLSVYTFDLSLHHSYQHCSNLVLCLFS